MKHSSPHPKLLLIAIKKTTMIQREKYVRVGKLTGSF
jgi:hypothetical protein